MRKRTTVSRRTLISNGNKRRLMLKRVHKKVLLRRQQYHQFDLQEQCTEVL
ncbi:hypothetical protein [Aliiglaciecola litoralis]|uniref:hypothetical protein n=1 Tax=Aliiglaciecola litoralis TaxID=582857 RepID=UPI0031D0105F